MSSTSPPEVSIGAIRLSVRLSHVFPAFDNNILRRVLMSIGFELTIDELPKGTIGLEVVSTGRMARREDIELEYNADKQVLGIIGNKREKVVNTFEEVLNAINKTISPNKLKVFFYETVITGLAEGTKSPLEAFASEENAFKHTSELNKLFGESVSPLSFRVCPTRRPVDNTDWFEYRIEPLNYQPEKLYTFSIIYRNKNFSSVQNTASNSESLVKNLVKLIEK